MSNGLFDAATATGSCAIPVTEPGPDGTCWAYAAHPVPMRSAAALVGAGAAAVLVSAAAADVADVSDAPVLLPPEHAAAPKIATAARPATAADFR